MAAKEAAQKPMFKPLFYGNNPSELHQRLNRGIALTIGDGG
jgi:hypothetical protein